MSFKQLRKRACSPVHRLSKATFLAMLTSNVDTDNIRVVATGEVISLSNVDEIDVEKNINKGIWERIELSYPRKLYLELDNDDWDIISFNPESREVCVEIRTSNGTRTTSQTLPDLSNSSKTSVG